MKSLLIGTTLIASTYALIALFPTSKAGTQAGGPDIVAPRQLPSSHAQNRAAVDVVFVLDTTSSMAGFIDTAKEKIWSIATTMTSAQQAPDIRIGLVAFRDRGDSYITQTVDLSYDLDSTYAKLMEFEARGGGDGPESVNAALEDAVNSMSWQPGSNRYQAIFLVGDAPPHMDYQNDTPYTQTIADASQLGIIVNTIQCGVDAQTSRVWQHMAQLGAGNYFQVEQSGGALAVSTPYDLELARLSAELDETRMFYGDEVTRQSMRSKTEATRKLKSAASTSSLARRGAFNASSAGKKNQWGENELVDDLNSGRVTLETLPAKQLPEALQKLDTQEQKAAINDVARKREALQAKVKQLVKNRADYIAKEIDAVRDDSDSLDFKLYEAVRDQGKKLGLTYDKGPTY